MKEDKTTSLLNSFFQDCDTMNELQKILPKDVHLKQNRPNQIEDVCLNAISTLGGVKPMEPYFGMLMDLFYFISVYIAKSEFPLSQYVFLFLLIIRTEFIDIFL